MAASGIDLLSAEVTGDGRLHELDHAAIPAAARLSRPLPARRAVAPCKLRAAAINNSAPCLIPFETSLGSPLPSLRRHPDG